MLLAYKRDDKKNSERSALTKKGTCAILIVEKSWIYINPIDKGKPFERMGHKALEPTSPQGLTVVSCQKGQMA